MLHSNILTLYLRITLPCVEQLWVKPAAASSLMPLYQNPSTDLILLHHLLLCSPIYKSPCSKGKFPRDLCFPIQDVLQKASASCHQQKKIHFETSDRWSFLSPSMMCFLLRETSSCVASEESDSFFATWAQMQNQKKQPPSPLPWVATLNLSTRLCKAFLPTQKEWKIQCCAGLRKGSPLQLYVQLHPVLKTFLSGGRGTNKAESWLSSWECQMGTGEKACDEMQAAENNFTGRASPRNYHQEKKPVVKASHNLFQPKLATL